MAPLVVTVRPERSADRDAIRALHEAVFEEVDEGEIVDAIRGTADAIDGGSLVALDGSGAVIGHLLASRGVIVGGDGTERPVWMLGPFAVRADVQGRGVGARLMREQINLATKRGAPLICLLGAASYYPRFGFQPARSMGIEPPQPWPDEHWQALKLPAYSQDLRGTARYAAPFKVD
ncbi:MAG: putative acetyltransferase [Chloroflexota bacterium]|jgi:predicted N-acetyltransferase YhbS|nr:putative acetyltransferase [Chloroflexota bacterium]